MRPYLLLALLWAVVFHPLVLHPSATLYADDSDFLAQHLPAKLFLNREVREGGELPLWNPYHFGGTPFVHDIQVGVFYPPYAVTYFVPEHALGAALSWVVALHVLLGGVLMYVYARTDGLGEIGAFVAAAGFMLAGKWMTHLLVAGHTVTVGLAWLPLVLLWLGRGVRTGRPWPAVGAGAAFALLVLGTHPQWAFYAGVFAAAWTLGEADWTARGAGRWLVAGAIVGVVAFGLTAVQLLPTAEASRYTARAGGVEASGSLTLGLDTFLGLVGPAVLQHHPQMWETRGVFGAVWLAAALAAPAARWRVGVLLGMILFAVGGAALVEWLPGFGLFRVPGRMLLIAAFPVALLAGTTTDALVRSGWSADVRIAVRGRLKLVAVAAVPLCLAVPLFDWWTRTHRYLWGPGLVGWAGTLLALAVVWWVLRSPAPRPRLWVAVLLLELLAPTILLPDARPQEQVYPAGPAARFLTDHPGRVLDATGGERSVLGVGAPLALVYRIEAARGYNPLDVAHYREYLAQVAGDPGPVGGNSPFAQQVIPDFVVQDRARLDRLGVRWLVCPDDRPLPPGPWRPVLTDPAPPAVPPLKPGAVGAIRELPPHTVYENPQSFPRAWVEGDGGEVVPARLTDYRPNQVRVELPAAAGRLVLTDVWFPGWVCRIDGAELPVERAHHAFRAVPVPPGATEAVFTFEPQSYRVGWWVSIISLGLLAAAGLIRLLSGGLRPAGPGRIPVVTSPGRP